MLVLTRSDREGLLFRLKDGSEFRVFVDTGRRVGMKVIVDAPKSIAVTRIDRDGNSQVSKPFHGKGKDNGQPRVPRSSR